MSSLIIQGRYEEALKYNCLNQRVGPSDARAPLYKVCALHNLQEYWFQNKKQKWKEINEEESQRPTL